MNLFEFEGLAASRELNVSRETVDKLNLYMALLIKWCSAINLVSKTTLADGWKRHILDSAQIWPKNVKFQTWVDIGSGAGFPGMVIAILANELHPEAVIHLIESDARKCAFLRNVSRETEVSVQIHTCRIDSVMGLSADILSARALASVDSLLESAEKLLKPDGYCLFLKGRNSNVELAEAAVRWKYKLKQWPSLTNDSGCVLQIEEVTRVIPA